MSNLNTKAESKFEFVQSSRAKIKDPKSIKLKTTTRRELTSFSIASQKKIPHRHHFRAHSGSCEGESRSCKVANLCQEVYVGQTPKNDE